MTLWHPLYGELICSDLLQSLFSGFLVCSTPGSSVSALWNELQRTFCLNEGGLWIQVRRVFSLNNIPWKKNLIFPSFLFLGRFICYFYFLVYEVVFIKNSFGCGCFWTSLLCSCLKWIWIGKNKRHLPAYGGIVYTDLVKHVEEIQCYILALKHWINVRLPLESF